MRLLAFVVFFALGAGAWVGPGSLPGSGDKPREAGPTEGPGPSPATRTGAAVPAVNSVVADPAPIPFFVARTYGMIVSADASGSQPSLGNAITSYFWDFGDGTVGTGMVTSHTYATSDRHSIRLTITDSGGLSANTTRYVSPATTTVDILMDRAFQAGCPYHQYWLLRHNTYGDVILRDSPPCVDYAPWVLYATGQSSQNPSNLETLFHLDARVVNHPGYSVWNPVVLPVFNASAAPAPNSFIGLNLTFNYLDYNSNLSDPLNINYWDSNTSEKVNPKYSDGFGYLVRGNISMDLIESKRIFGFVAGTRSEAQTWWNQNTLPGGGTANSTGPLETNFRKWLDQQGNGPYDIFNGFQWYYESDIADLNATVAPDGTTTIRVFLDGWGLDVLLAR